MVLLPLRQVGASKLKLITERSLPEVPSCSEAQCEQRDAVDRLEGGELVRHHHKQCPAASAQTEAVVVALGPTGPTVVDPDAAVVAPAEVNVVLGLGTRVRETSCSSSLNLPPPTKVHHKTGRATEGPFIETPSILGKLSRLKGRPATPLLAPTAGEPLRKGGRGKQEGDLLLVVENPCGEVLLSAVG